MSTPYTSQTDISIIIPTYNGKELLEEYLPSVVEASEKHPGNVEIIIVENGSSDGTVPFLNETFPAVRILQNSTNLGFGKAVNRGVRESSYPLVLLLNNDIRVEPDFIAPLVKHFTYAENLFAVVAASMVQSEEKGLINESLTTPSFKMNHLQAYQPMVHTPEKTYTYPVTCFHASGGFSLISKEKFLALGGFDDIFSPFYYEDIDLSYQAWKRGWEIIYEPESIVYHRSHATSEKLTSRRYVDCIEQRNKFLFTWCAIRDAGLLIKHLKWMKHNILASFNKTKWPERFYTRCFFMALLKLPQVLLCRRRRKPFEKLTDAQVFLRSDAVETTEMKYQRLLSSLPPLDKEKISILLIDPPGFQQGLNIGLGYLNAALRSAGICQVETLDLNNTFRGLSKEKIITFIQQRGFDIVGFSIKTPTFNSASELSRHIREQCPGVIQIAGGAHISLSAEEFMQQQEQFDFCIAGEAEESLVALCRELETKKPEEVNRIDGVLSRHAYNKNKEVPKNIFIKDLDTLPFPVYEGFHGFSDSSVSAMKEYLIVTSRGCPYLCTYCSVGIISGHKMRFREVEEVIRELKQAKEKYGITRFNIIDDNFTQHVKRAKQLCRRMIEEKLNLVWHCGNGIRADMLDQELAFLMREAGCELVCIGIENADPAVFHTIKKGETLEEVARGIRYLKNAQIEVVGFFIIGLPGDSPRSSELSLRFIEESGLDSARYGILLPYPKTEVFDILQQDATFLRDYKEGIHFSDTIQPVFETERFSAGEMVDTYKKLYTKLRYFNFILPDDLSEWERKKRVFALTLQYDPSHFIVLAKRRIKRYTGWGEA